MINFNFYVRELINHFLLNFIKVNLNNLFFSSTQIMLELLYQYGTTIPNNIEKSVIHNM